MASGKSLCQTESSAWCSRKDPPPGDLPNPGSEPRCPTPQAGSLPAEPPGKHLE